MTWTGRSFKGSLCKCEALSPLNRGPLAWCWLSEITVKAPGIKSQFQVFLSHGDTRNLVKPLPTEWFCEDSIGTQELDRLQKPDYLVEGGQLATPAGSPVT